MPRGLAVLVLAVTLAAPGAARAERSRAVAVGAAVFPGAVVHGSGHWVAGDRRAARRIAIAELVGLGLAALGGIPIGVSGGAPQTMPGLALVVPGGALLIQSWLADVYGAAGGSRIGGRAGREPRLELEAGYALIADAQSDTGHLATLAATARVGRATVGASGYAGDGAWSARGEFGLRALGDRLAHADVFVAAAERRFDDDGFRTAVLELFARGRYELERFTPSLGGSFATLELGVGRESLRYNVPDVPADTQSVLVARFGYGLHLGDHAETELYYDHRRDDLAGALLHDLPHLLGSNGFAGHLGLRAAARRGRFGLTAAVEVGSAWVFHLALTTRIGQDLP
jgi:hypothetical protein